MASAPNMNMVPAVPQAGAVPPVEGGVGDLFASLLPIVTGTIAIGPDASGTAPSHVTSVEVAAGTPTMPGLVPGEAVAVDLHAVAPKSEGGEAETDDAADRDEMSPLLAEADFLPALQAQSDFPITVIAASVVAPAPGQAQAQVRVLAPAQTTEAPILSKPQASAAQPAAPIQPLVAVVPQFPIPGPTGRLLVDAQPAPQDPAIAVAVRQVVESLKDRDSDAGTEAPASKMTAKGGLVQPVKIPAETNAPGAAPTITSVREVPSERSMPIEKAAAPAPAPMQTPIVQTSSVPAAILPVVAAIDPAASLQPARTEASASQPAPSGEAAIARELDLAHESEWLDRLARDIARTGANDGPMRFKLNPNTLGHLQVELAQGDRGTSIRLTVETEAARNILSDAQPRLMAEARAQGVRIAQSEIDLSGNGHQASGDPRRHQEDARQTVLIRTARGPDGETAATVTPARTRADRYA